MAIALKSKPGITGASSLSIPKDWDPAWFRGYVNNMLKGADVRNAIGGTAISISGSIASPYATISAGTSGTATAATFLRGDGAWSNILTNTNSAAALTLNGNQLQTSGELLVNNTSSGNAQNLLGNFTNSADADLNIYVTQIGAASKYSSLGTSVANPLNFFTANATRMAISAGGAVVINPPTSGLGLLVGGGLASPGYGYAASASIASWMIGNTASGGGFNLGFGSNVTFDGTNWRTNTDGASNGGFLIVGSYGGDQCNIYTTGSTGGTSQAISTASLAALQRLSVSTNYTTGYYNNSNFGASANAVAGLILNNASSTMQTVLEFQKAGVVNGRVRSDYAGNMNYATTGAGAHYFFVGGDSGVGVTTMILTGTLTTIGTALSLSGVTTSTTAPAAGGAGALPATPAGYMAITINGTARRIPYYT